MANEEKKKGLFGKAIDALTSRDEKEAAEKAQQAEAEAKKQAEMAKAAQDKANQEAARARAAAAEAEKRAQEAEAALKQKALEEEKQKTQEKLEQAKREREEAIEKFNNRPKFIAEHEVKAEETLSHLALKYYGNATRPYWMLIYEANKEVIGSNPSIIRPGMALNIPELPEELKKA